MRHNELVLHPETTQAWELFEQTTYPWEVLPLIKAFVLRLGPTLPAFVSPGILRALVEGWDIAPVSTPEADIAALMER